MYLSQRGLPSSANTITETITNTVTETLAGNKTSTGDWSSLIGILTAIGGNLLISVALNTQRYAHIRLERERVAADEKLHNDQQQYGSIDERLHNGSSGDATPTRISPSTPPNRNLKSPTSEQNETDALLSRSREDADDTRSMSSGMSGGSQKKHYLKSPYWWLGIGLMVVGEAGNFLAYGFAPASIVSPLGVVALISNCLIAPFMLHEKFRKRDLLGVLIAVGGAVTVVLTAKGSNPKLGPDEIWEYIRRWEFETYLGICLVCIVVLMFASSRLGHKTIAIDIGLVGLFGGYTALSTKGIASLLSYRFWRVITFPVTYLLVAVLVGTAVMQIKYLNRALQRFDSTQVIPAQFVTFTIFVILGSAILYRDFESTTVQQMAQFIGGCALTFLGVWVITSGRKPQDNSSTEDEAYQATDDQIQLVDEEARQEILDLTASAPTTPVQELPAPTYTTPHETSLTSRQDISTPLVALHNTASTPQLPLSSTSVEPTPRPTLMQREVTEPVLQTTPGQDRRGSRFLRARPSVSDMLPQPFTSPLSSSLSGIIADAQRRDKVRRTSSTRIRRRASSRSAAVDLFTESNRLSVADQAGEGLSRTISGPAHPTAPT